jgi:pimeloyl-ACP methyl ester carboxylesterase
MMHGMSGPFGRPFLPILKPLRHAILSITASFAIRTQLGIQNASAARHSTADDIRDLRDVGIRDPIDVIASLARPILIMHGDNDVVLPHIYSQQLYEAAAQPKVCCSARDIPCMVKYLHYSFV